MEHLYDQARQCGAGVGKAGQRVYALNTMMVYVSQWKSCFKGTSRGPEALHSYLDDFTIQVCYVGHSKPLTHRPWACNSPVTIC